MRRYLSDPTFSHFDTIPECDGHTHTHTHTHRRTDTRRRHILRLARRRAVKMGFIMAFLHSGVMTSTENDWVSSKAIRHGEQCCNFVKSRGCKLSGPAESFDFSFLIVDRTSDSVKITDSNTLMQSTVRKMATECTIGEYLPE